MIMFRALKSTLKRATTIMLTLINIMMVIKTVQINRPRGNKIGKLIILNWIFTSM